MKKITSVISLPLIMLLAFSRPTTPNYEYIRFEYMGDMDKPIPIVLLYKGDGYDTTLASRYDDYIFKLEDKNFECAQKSIENNRNLVNHPIAPAFYSVIVKKNGKEAVYYARYIDSTEKMFDDVVVSLQNSDKNNELKKAFRYVINRFPKVR